MLFEDPDILGTEYCSELYNNRVTRDRFATRCFSIEQYCAPLILQEQVGGRTISLKRRENVQEQIRPRVNWSKQGVTHD